MNKTKRIILWILLPVAVLAVMFGTEAFCQRDILSLPREQRVVTSLPLTADSVSVALPEGAEADTDDYGEYEDDGGEEAGYEDEEDYEDEEASAPAEDVLSELPAGAVAAFPYEGYISRLVIHSDADGQSFTITSVMEDGSTASDSHIFFGGGHQDTSRVDRKVTSFSLCFPDSPVALTAVEVDNTFTLNGNRMLLTGLMTTCFYLLIALRKVIGKRLEIGFLIVALAAGLYMSIGLPANVTLSYDDQIHFERVSKLSSGHYASVSGQAADMAKTYWSTIISESFVHTADTLEDERLFLQLIDQEAESSAFEEEIQWQFSDTGYVTQSLGFGLGRLLGLPFHMQFILGRVFNMLTYVLLCYFGIRTLKRFKATMAVVALMPTPMFLSANYSYDPTINGLCFLGLALVMDAIMDRETRLSWQRALGILLCLMLGALTKIVYMPLLLLTLLLPRGKFDSNALRIWYKVMAVVIMLAAILAMVFSVSGGMVQLQDTRSDGADSAAQIAFILQHPFTYLGYFFSYLWDNFTVYFVDACRTTLAYAGGVGGMTARLGFWLILFTAFTDNDPELNQRLNWKLRLSMLIIGGLAVGMVFTTMYVAFSSVGVQDFGGVQGRYLIPVLPLMYMLISPDGIKNRMNKTGWHLAFCCLNALLLGSVCLQLFETYFL